MHAMQHLAAQNSTSWRLSENSNKKSSTETKPATTSWSELDMNHHFLEISVEPKLGIETSKYSTCQF